MGVKDFAQVRVRAKHKVEMWLREEILSNVFAW